MIWLRREAAKAKRRLPSPRTDEMYRKDRVIMDEAQFVIAFEVGTQKKKNPFPKGSKARGEKNEKGHRVQWR